MSLWVNWSQSLLNSLDHIHARARRIIHHLSSSQESGSCLLQCNWLPINYLYKRRILVKMHQIFVGTAPSQILDMFSISSRSTRFFIQFNIIRVKSELGKNWFPFPSNIEAQISGTLQITKLNYVMFARKGWKEYLLSILIYTCLQKYFMGYVERWDTLLSYTYITLSLWQLSCN